MLYSYQKATPDLPSPGKVIPHYLRVLPTLVSAIGLGLVATVVWPIGSYNLSLFMENNNKTSSLLNPIIYESFASETDNKSDEPALIANVDYTKASNWFTFSPQDVSSESSDKPQFIDLNGITSQNPGQTPSETNVSEYHLAIPSLGIKSASVKANIDDLTKSLVQYQQTSFPGEAGTPVIFGHSTLPQFFNPNNYLTIFSTLPKIELGADIFVDYAGVEYTYRVSKKFEVKPDEVWVLRQDYNQKTIKLITCVPPGTKLRRLVVEAELIKS